MKNLSISLSGIALALVALGLHAAVPADQAARLESSLTPVGAERSGNQNGSIPSWNGGLKGKAGTVDAFGHLSDPFASESPLFTITAKNAEQYRDKLSEGQLALFKRYPNSFQMPVYPTHRTASVPESVAQSIRQNAISASLMEGGNGLQGFSTAIPFPIPQNGIEVVWNHIARYRGGSVQRTIMQTAPLVDGSYVPVTMSQWFTYRDHVKDFDPANPGNVLFYYMQAITSPARLSGNVLLVHETLDQVKEPRKAWIYTAGQRRVRRAPQVAYDGPSPGAEGQRVADNTDMYNGSPDRYEWKLIGKQELYIPYNAYKLQSPELKYDEIIKPGHINSNLTRYELHRVWVVEADLKEGERHVYAKRKLYIDEDSWQIVVAEHYDARGDLWRVGEGFITQVYDKQIPWLSVEALYDLHNGRYVVSGLRNEERSPMEFGTVSSSSDYTPSALRKVGIR
ncbi:MULTISPECIES: DUF1329 domain-containing protein [unclassified Pseudomonas]|uniref:DUF1329 domain-containing protein n=1 Tax=unclassified Pseudomonas TaxID=196821 RepID=UPI000877238E|nr:MULTISPECIES: DUF1329 domain-containing protein [unclassified Pseudomonas]SCZ39915.1 Protein of unknown function [Pseudomonas sp. NFACC44-2]SDA89781.1 Protein of unknown function [Pseudomonas sp. NFACC51]SDW43092.1 Protein of unknown function [Pseudomonas sp. NFACC08-1]SFI16191.1 Protein of unknown function [Pseudomonas sp. NFACC54]SFT28371.1 Protein of unknown function [Pseudomonas sp. NFACC48-1]